MTKKPPQKEAPELAGSRRNADEIQLTFYRAFHGMQMEWHREAMRLLEVYQGSGARRDLIRYYRHVFGNQWGGTVS